MLVVRYTGTPIQGFRYIVTQSGFYTNTQNNPNEYKRVFTIGPAIEFLQVISVKPVQYMYVFASPVELSIMWLFLEHTSISALQNNLTSHKNFACCLQ